MSRPILAYKIIESSTAKALVIAINVVIEEGWEPLGAPGQVVFESPETGIVTESWWQAIVKRATNPQPLSSPGGAEPQPKTKRKT